MTEVSIKYNPFTVESEITVNGARVEAPNKLFDLKNERIQVWIENLIPILDEMCNDDEYKISFYGTNLDCNDVESVLKEYEENHSDTKIDLELTEAKGSEDRFEELVELFNDMQKNCPFDDLKTDQIRENFENAVSSEFEVSVIATMSSGKSTLINSLLGRELMPSKNEACTATIAKIRDIDEMDHFEASYRDRDNNILGEYKNLCVENMEEMNDNPNTAYIDIEGDVPNIDSSGVRLVLVDTPGPNNSRTEDHKAHTYRVIKEKTKPMVLYVLNATQLQTNDDKELLTAVSDAMKVGGKQSKDRFLFAVNKIDMFDPDKESVQGALNNVREYLKKFGIENPNIYPTSAETAKVIRMHQNGIELTKGQKKTLRNIDDFLEEDQLHLSEQASLSRDNMAKVKREIDKAKQNGDENTEALLYTGIPAVEYAIDEYLRKYAYTAKVKTAVDTFRKKVEEKDMQAKMMKAISDNEEERQRIHDQLVAVKKLLDEGESAQEFRERIENLDMMKDAQDRIAEIRSRISSEMMNKDGNIEITVTEAQTKIMSLQMRISDLESNVHAELDNIIDDVVIDGANKIMKEYQERVQGLLSSGAISKNESFSKDASIDFLSEGIPDAQELINDFKYTEVYDTGETEKNDNKKWYKPWTWFQPSIRPKKGTRDMVNFGEVYDEFIAPITTNFEKNLKIAKDKAEQEANRFKEHFLNVLDELEAALKKKVEENERLTKDQAGVEKEMEENKHKMEWLDQFMKKLDAILEV